MVLPTSGFWPFLNLGPVQIPTYYLIISFVLVGVILWTDKRAQKYRLNERFLMDLVLVTLITGFLGARFFHIFLEEPFYYWEKPERVLEIWMGGFVWYGGMIGALIATWIFVRRKKEKYLFWADFLAPSLAVGYGLGRLACFFTGCCYGAICKLSDHAHFMYPTQLFAIVWDCVLGWICLRRGRSITKWGRGQIFFFWLFWHAVGRLIMEYFRDDPRGPILFQIGPSGWLSLTVLIFIGVLFLPRKLNNQSRGA